MEFSDIGESLIWSNMNDSRNLNVIKKENHDIKHFVPKTVVEKFIEEDTEDYEKTYNDILLEDYTVLNSLEIIKKQYFIMFYLINHFKTVESDKIVWMDFKPGLMWILNSSEHICVKKNIKINVSDTDKVHRCSYKFCELGERCYPVYGGIFTTVKTSTPCNSDHYVHNKIVQDITCLVAVVDRANEVLYDDLRLCLTTLEYVLKHMCNELDSVCAFLMNEPDFNVETYYKVKIYSRNKQTGDHRDNSSLKDGADYKDAGFKSDSHKNNKQKYNKNKQAKDNKTAYSNRFADLSD